MGQTTGPRLASTSLDAVRRLERFGLAALPAKDSWKLPGWLCLTNGGGHVGRVNSATPDPEPSTGDGLSSATILQIADNYRSRGLEPLIRWTPLAPAGLAEQLAAAGWRSGREVLVMTRDLRPGTEGVAAEIPVTDASVHDNRADQVDLLADASRSWRSAYTSAYDAAEGDVRLELALSAPRPRRFAELQLGSETAGVGLGVCLDGVVGVFDVLTLPAFRRRGVAARVVSSLLEWGRHEGSELAFLQVAGGNAAAVGLYRQLGFETAYSYLYASPSLGPA